MSFLEYIVVPFGWLLRVMYSLVGNYGFALLLFTVLTRLLMLPLGISQQKSMAKMSVYNPLIQEVQKKYANNREKQQEELTKLYTEYNIKPTTGCLPMLIQFPLIMILYQVIQKPLRYLVGVSLSTYNQLVELAKTLPGCPAHYQDTFIIGQIQAGNQSFIDLMGAKTHAVVEGLDFSFFGIKAMDLTAIPTWGWNLLLLIPIASALSMIVSQYITTKVTGQKMQGGMAVVMYGMSLWIGYLGFTFPAALSLYWFYSNVLALVQTIVLKKYYNPETFKAQIQAELEAKRAEKKKKKSVTVTDGSGEKVEKNLSEAELAKLRLARARALQDEHFKKQAEEDAKAKADEASGAAENTETKTDDAEQAGADTAAGLGEGLAEKPAKKEKK